MVVVLFRTDIHSKHFDFWEKLYARSSVHSTVKATVECFGIAV